MKSFLTLLAVTVSLALSAQFANYYDPSNWTLTNSPACDDGYVDAAAAPASITLVGSEVPGCDFSTVAYSITTDICGTISFDWDYTTVDCNGSFYDRFGYSLNGIPTQLSVDCVNCGHVQSGSVSIAVEAGDVFSFYMSSIDNICGRAWSVISNFSGADAVCFGDDGEVKVELCHNGRSICVAPSAVAAHLAHGDQYGTCYEAEGCEEEAGGFHAVESAVDPVAQQQVKAIRIRKAADELYTALATKAAAEVDLANEVYPNPAKDVTNIKLDRMEGNVTISVYNLNGQLVMQATKEVVRNMPFELNTESLMNGNYEIRFESGAGMTLTKKLTVLRGN